MVTAYCVQTDFKLLKLPCGFFLMIFLKHYVYNLQNKNILIGTQLGGVGGDSKDLP